MKKRIRKLIDRLVNKPIELSKYEVTWIKLFKYHYQDEPYGKLTGSWITTMLPIFIKIYGYDPDENNNYNDYLKCMFNKLIEIYFKINDDRSGHNYQLKDIISASFHPSISNDSDKPIERVIHALISHITNTSYLNEYGNPRYLLDKDIFND